MEVIRQAHLVDVPAMARIRAAEWETEDYWCSRISGYMNGKLSPQQATPPRIIYVAREGDVIVGFIAGHLTRRFDCAGELQWIDVVKAHRRKGIASAMVRRLTAWFVEQNAFRVCVDPGNPEARLFYAYHGAVALNKHWLVWADIQTAIEGAEKYRQQK